MYVRVYVFNWEIFKVENGKLVNVSYPPYSWKNDNAALEMVKSPYFQVIRDSKQEKRQTWSGL